MRDELPPETLRELTAFRRDLHRHPETGFELERTAGKVADRLEAAGLTVTRDIGQTGLVATLNRGNSNRAIGFRADMDALPVTEANDFDHRSRHDGKFHGCGHDGHTTMLLGAALTLSQAEAFDSGTVHFIFQPDEENGTGAQAMIDDGLFERFPMDAVYGLHNLPGLPTGSFAIQEGEFCTFETNFEIKILGRGGHASMPERAIDPLIAASSIILNLQSIVSRSTSPKDHAVVSVTDIVTDGARNIIPSTVTVSGDCRGFSDETSDMIRARMDQIAKGICEAHGATYDFSYTTSFVPLINHPEYTALAAEAASAVPQANIDRNFGTVGFSEDFALMLQQCPGAFILLGNGTEGPHGNSLHNPSYDFNDDAIANGVAYWCALAKAAFE